MLCITPNPSARAAALWLTLLGYLTAQGSCSNSLSRLAAKDLQRIREVGLVWHADRDYERRRLAQVKKTDNQHMTIEIGRELAWLARIS